MPAGRHRPAVLALALLAGAAAPAALTTAAVAEPVTPTISAVSPSSIGPGGQRTVTVSGSNFAPDVKISVPGSGLAVAALSRIGSGQLTVLLSTANDAVPGPRNVVVTNVADGRGSTCTGCVNVTTGPTVSSLAPAVLGGGAQTTVTVTGTNIADGAWLSFAGTGVAVLSQTRVDDSHLSATVSLAGAAVPGPRVVSVTNPDSGRGTCATCFGVTAAPAVTGLTPSGMLRGATTGVTITGSGFVPGAGVNLSTGMTISNVTVVDSGTITATVAAAANTGAGQRTLTVTNPDFGRASLVGVMRVSTTPGTPVVGTATASDGSATVAWSPPASDGGYPVSGYLVTASPGGASTTVSGALRATVGGLSNGTGYTFTVSAINAAGTGPASAVSATVVPRRRPDAPTGVNATAGVAQATVSWTAPGSDGGAPITGYTVTASPGGATATTTGATGATVTGLAGGTAYSFTVSATNAAGTGPESAPSTVVTPAASPVTSPVMTAGSVATVTALSTANGVAYLNGAAYLADGTRIVRVNSSSGAVSVLAGTATSTGCADAPTGAAVQFWDANSLAVVGSDGRYLYVTDTCGLRRVDPVTGGTVTLTSTQYSSVAISGQVLYGRDGYTIYRRDLTTGATAVVSQSAMPGPIAADSGYLWILSEGSLYRLDPATNQSVLLATGLPASAPSAVLSVGDYLYASVRSPISGRYPMLDRIAKATGASQLVDTTGDGIDNVTGIASDGGRLYVADSSRDGGWLRTVTPADARPYAVPASGPVLEEGSVSTVTSAGALSGANGVAVLGGFAFVADGARIIRVDPGSGAISVLAGSANSSGCADTPVGAAAQFWPDGDVKVVGSDGRYVFVTDSCGLRRVDPVTGGTVTLTTAQYTSVTIAGHSLYAVDGSSLYRYDLDTGILSRLGWAPGGVIAADANQLWAVDGSVLSRVDPTNGRTTTVTTNLPTYAGTPPSALLSAGDYLYAAPRGHAPGYGSTLIRIDKATGVWKPVAGVDAAGHVDGVELDAWFGGIRGIASDGTRLYVADSGAGYGSWLRAVQG